MRHRTGNDFKTNLALAGVNLPSVINGLTAHLNESKHDFRILCGMMDEKTMLSEKVRILELELFVELLKKL